MRPWTCVAIDPGARALKVAWLTARGQKMTWHADERMCRPDEPPEELAEKLDALLRPLKRRRFDIPVLLAAAQGHVRLLTLEAPRAMDLPAAVRERMPRLFPFEPARCRYAFHQLAQQPTNGAHRYTLQVAACDLERLRRDTALLERIGWIPSHAYPAALALGSLAAAHGQGAGSVFLLDVGATRSVLSLAVNGQVVFSREVSLGAAALTEALTAQVMVGDQSLQLSWEQAEALKNRVGLLAPEAAPGAAESPLPLPMYRAMLYPVLEQWLEEIRRTMAFGAQSLREADPAPVEGLGEAMPTRVLLSGGGSELAGFDQWLAQQLGIPVERLAVGPLGDVLRPRGLSPGAFAVSCGLLMRGGVAGANLLLPRSVQIRSLIRAERGLIKGLAVGLVGIWLAASGLAREHRPLQRDLAPVEQRWQALEPVRSLIQAVVSRMQVISALAGARGVPVDWFNRLANGFPNPIRLTELSVGIDGKVTLVGQAQARDQTSEAYVSELALWLVSAQVCHDVRLGASQRSTQHAGLVDFRLTCQR